MTTIVSIDNSQYAVELTWVSVLNERQASTEVRQQRGQTYVSRKCPDKTMQIGIVHGTGFNNMIVAADMYSSADISSAYIVVTKVKKQDDTDAWLGIASSSGKILAGGDILLSSRSEAIAWIKEMLSVYMFETYIDDDVAHEIPDILAKHPSLLLNKSKRLSKLKIQQKLDQNSKSGAAVIALFAVIVAIAGGGYYFYSKTQNEKTREYSQEEKDALLKKIKEEEIVLIKKALNQPKFDDIGIHLNKALSYPRSAVNWNVAAINVDIPSSVIQYVWQMGEGGFMSQIKAVRPNVAINFDNTSTSGTTGTEVINIKYTPVDRDFDLNRLPSESAVSEFLIEINQRFRTAFTIKGKTQMPVSAIPPQSGVIFKPTYYSNRFEIKGSNILNLFILIDAFKGSDYMIPDKISMLASNNEITGWSISGFSYNKQ